MKICFIAPKAYPLFNPNIKSTFGGAEVQLFLLATELSKNKNLDVHFMVADYGQKNAEKIKSVCIWNCLNFSDNILIQIFKFFKTFLYINSDVYIQRTLTPQSGLIALYCKFKQKKFIYMVAHDKETDGTHIVYKRKISSILANLVFKCAYKIIVQNNYQYDQISKANKKLGVTNKVVVLNSSYNIKQINDIDKVPKTNILWVGRSEPWKNPELFLKLATLNPEIKFVMVCPKSTNNSLLFEFIKEKAKKIDNLEFHSFIPFNEIDSFFEHAKIYVSTSEKEGFQNTLIQAAKSKTPILSLNVNPNNFISRYKCGFYCKHNFKHLNDKLGHLFNNKDLYDQMSKNAYEYAKKNHDIKINSKKLLEFLTT